MEKCSLYWLFNKYRWQIRGENLSISFWVAFVYILFITVLATFFSLKCYQTFSLITWMCGPNQGRRSNIFPDSICHGLMPLYLSLFFLQCPHLYICIVCMYICLNCIYLYLYVYCQCLMLTVCTKGLRVTQFQFSVCMCCTCGRIDNKADLTWLLRAAQYLTAQDSLRNDLR